MLNFLDTCRLRLKDPPPGPAQFFKKLWENNIIIKLGNNKRNPPL